MLLNVESNIFICNETEIVSLMSSIVNFSNLQRKPGIPIVPPDTSGSSRIFCLRRGGKLDQACIDQHVLCAVLPMSDSPMSPSALKRRTERRKISVERKNIVNQNSIFQ